MIKEEGTAEKRARGPQKGDGLTSDFYFTMLPDALLDDESMGRRELMVYWAIARHADKNGEGAFPSIARLAKLSRYSRQAVIDSIWELVYTGWIDRQKRIKPNGGSTSNLYIVRKERLRRTARPFAGDDGGGGVQPVDGGGQVAVPPPSNGLTLTIPNELDPFNEELPPPGDKPKKKKIPGLKECTDHFFELFRDHFKNTKSPAWGGKETNLLKLDLKRVEGDHEYLLVAMEVFFDGDHRKTKDFAAEAGHEYGVFHGCLGGLLEYMRREEARGRADW